MRPALQRLQWALAEVRGPFATAEQAREQAQSLVTEPAGTAA
ncbi:hypothetical protein WMF30_09565 [Sorangium sp. So ce134]